MSIVSYPGNKSNKCELDGIQGILGYSCRTAKLTRHRVSANQAQLLSEPNNKSVKWAVKPQIVCKKKLDDALIQKFVYWVLRNSNVSETTIVRDTLIIDKHGNGVRTRVPKVVPECSVCKLHNDLISPPSEGGLEEARDCVTGEVNMSDIMIGKIIPE